MEIDFIGSRSADMFMGLFELERPAGNRLREWREIMRRMALRKAKEMFVDNKKVNLGSQNSHEVLQNRSSSWMLSSKLSPKTKRSKLPSTRWSLMLSST